MEKNRNQIKDQMKHHRMFHTILWDVDQTLLDFEKSQDYALRLCFQNLHLEISDEIVRLYSSINDSYWKRLERGEVTKKELLTGRFDALFEQLHIKTVTSADIAPMYQKALGSVYYYRDDSLTLCRRLKGRVRQYVVTNGVSSTQRNKLRLSGFDQVMDGIFISEEMNYEKPDVRFFEGCFKQIPDFRKEDTLIVGDSLTSDMQGGNQAGIACCWYNPDGKRETRGLKIDYEIQNLWEVEEILSWQNPQIKN